MNDILKSCHYCLHSAREQTGPHEFFHYCTLHQRDFPYAAQCGIYEPTPAGFRKKTKSAGLGFVADQDE